MTRRNLVNLLLLILVAMIAGWLLTTPDGDKSGNLQSLTQLEPDDIQRIRISNNNGPAFEMMRQQGRWFMIEPYRVPANGPRIEILLDLLSAPSYESYPMPEQSRLAEFGLDKPLAEVRFNDTIMRFGGTHPTNYRRYVQIGNRLHLTADKLTFSDFPRHFLARAEDFVSHALLAEGGRIKRITTPDWSLTKIDGNWRLTPAAEGVSADRLEIKAGDWESTWVAKVEKAPADPKGERIELEIDGKAQPVEIIAVKNRSALLLVRPDLGLAYRLPPSSQLLAPPR